MRLLAVSGKTCTGPSLDHVSWLVAPVPDGGCLSSLSHAYALAPDLEQALALGLAAPCVPPSSAQWAAQCELCQICTD